MNHKRKNPKRRIWRKELNGIGYNLKEWSRMLHRWWKVDLYSKSKKDYLED